MASSHSDEHRLRLKPVDRIRLDVCGREAFIAEYYTPGIPCIIEDLVDDWPASQKWTRDYFVNEVGGDLIRYDRVAEENPNPNQAIAPEETSIRDFIERIEKGEAIRHFGASHPYYDFVTTHPTLMSDVQLQSISNLVPQGNFLGLPRLDSRLWPWVSPYPPQMFIAGADKLSAGHYDPDMSHTFHWCVWGRKSVRLFPFHSETETMFWNISTEDLSQKLSTELVKTYPELQKISGWETTIEPGETLVIPSKMWHFFKNEETSMGFVVRARSYHDLEGYQEFATGPQSPLATIPHFARYWRLVDKKERSFLGNLMAGHEKLVCQVTRKILALAWLYLRLKGRITGKTQPN
jgi:hypothetical protein